MNINKILKTTACFIFYCALFGHVALAEEIGKWKKFETSYVNTTFSGNPFDLDVQATFVHTASGKTIVRTGFYAGSDTWKIYFMPNELGEWTFTTASSDSDLDGQSGSLTCIESSLPGQLMAEGNRWKFSDSEKYEMPIAIPTRQWFKSTETSNGIGDFITWANDTVGARIIGTTLVYFRHEPSASPYIKGKEGEEFNIPMWDRLDSHFDTMRDLGMGFYIMLYSDDAESPNLFGITEQSPEEIRLLNYVVARFSAYPIVIWDSGIDIGETRTNAGIDWLTDWFIANDSYGHMVSSRTGGGSGGKVPDNANYYSDGIKDLPEHATYVNTWESRSIPTFFTDRWRENDSRGDFDNAKIKQAVWQMGLVGGTGVYISGNENGGYLTETYQTDFTVAPQVGIASRFFKNNITNFGLLNPHDELIVSGNAILSALPGEEYVAYLPEGGDVQINLVAGAGTYETSWLNPRNGDLTSLDLVSDGVRTFSAEDANDWVLHIKKSDANAPNTPSTPTGLSLSTQ